MVDGASHEAAGPNMAPAGPFFQKLWHAVAVGKTIEVLKEGIDSPEQLSQDLRKSDSQPAAGVFVGQS